MITAAEFKAFFPQYAAVDDEIIENMIDVAGCVFSCCTCGEPLCDKITLYLAAHFLAISLVQMEGDPVAANPVQRKHIDELTIGFKVVGATNGTLDSMLMSTSYGQIARVLIKQCIYKSYGAVILVSIVWQAFAIAAISSASLHIHRHRFDLFFQARRHRRVHAWLPQPWCS